MYFFDYDDSPKNKTYPGRNLVLGFQTLLIFGIVVFGIQAVHDAFDSSYSYNYTYSSSSNGLTVMDYYQIGLDYRYQGDFENAIIAYDNAIALAPNFSWAYLNRGVLYELVGDNESSGSDFYTFMRKHAEDIQLYELTDFSETMPIMMQDGRVVAFEFSAYAGDMISFSAIAHETNSVDPLILLTDGNGQIIDAQDDMFDNGTWVNMDAEMKYVIIPADCDSCRLLVSHAGGGAEGLIDVDFTLHTSPITSDDDCGDYKFHSDM